MADYIFTQGACTKFEVYTNMINSMIAAGWKNISSNSTTDFDVMQSTGEGGDKNLIIQLRPANAAGANPTTTTDSNAFSYRLVDSYTPGTNGAAGTFGRNTTVEPWITLWTVHTTTNVAGSTPMTYFINANKNRVIMVIEPPIALNLGPVINYIGIPDEVYVSEPASRGLLIATTTFPRTAGNIHITNSPGELASDAASSNRIIYTQLAPKNPNSAGRYSMSEIKYGSSTESWRGKITGIFQLPNGNVSNGDYNMNGSKKYRIVVAGAAGSFLSQTFAIQVDATAGTQT